MELGGLWDTDNCSNHDIWTVSSYTCAFQEGIADYGGSVGAPNESRGGVFNYETVADTAPAGAKVEGNVAALFHDLLDSSDEGNDQTNYDGTYVFEVFRTCDVRVGGSWDDRDDVSDFVWCLEEGVNQGVHETHFDDINPTPTDAREWATEPGNHNATHIRNTWIQNVGSG